MTATNNQIDNLVALLDGYVSKGGHHLNVNVFTKETLLVKIWGYESDAEDNNVEVYISFLRKKLDHLRSRVKIRTIRMVGYTLEDSAP